ncbi:MAG TPA: hypothetical protein VKQ36_09110 [Ktedonobacterales bacterium]|nr:hypothetical protein [Ktedonobacterales bacterium]
MLVLKFGGSSMADAGRILASAHIVRQAHEHDPVTVVVSAMAGVTDALLSVANMALAGKSGWRESLSEMEERHQQTFHAIGGWVPDVFVLRWRMLLAEAEILADSAHVTHGIGATTRSSRAERFSGWGERLAVDLMAQALAVNGALTQAFADEPVLLTGVRATTHATEGTHDKALIVEGLPQPSILATRATLVPRLALVIMRNGIPVLPGYIAHDSAGRATTLGRNGSDHSAAVIAAALGATGLYLYSDVAGLYTADPHVVPDAELLPMLTYSEAGEIAALGARALHPGAVEPTSRWGIPLFLRSSLTPDAPGVDILPDSVASDGAYERPEHWVVAARPLVERPLYLAPDITPTEASAGLVEVSATRLPSWPIQPVAARSAHVARGTLALYSDEVIHPLSVWSSPRQLRAVVSPDVSERTQRVLHTALLRAVARDASKGDARRYTVAAGE